MSAKNVKGIIPHLESLAEAALASLGVEERPSLAASPNPEMGDLGFPCFPFARALRRPPQQIAASVVEALAPIVEGDALVNSVHAAGPYVNFSLSLPSVLGMVLAEVKGGARPYGAVASPEGEAPVLIEYSSPNTNKPQHLGHVRNNLLGESVANLLSHQGRPVRRVNLINDRGIHICKSMVAYMKHGDGGTPESFGKKGDHLIGDFYVRYNSDLTQEYGQWLETEAADAAFAQWCEGEGQKAIAAWRKKAKKKLVKAGELTKEQPAPEAPEEVKRSLFKGGYQDVWFNTSSALGAETKELLVKWEAGDEEVRALWARLNSWVEAGFAATYERMGIHFDQIDHESETYLYGKELVARGRASGVFEESANGAMVFDLSRIGLNGEKAVLRPDGTSLYVTQDLGTANARFDAHSPQKMIYVVGDEQDHYFKVMFSIFGHLRPEAQGKMHHLSYGMVNLPHGRMKSREGTVVDADDLMDEMHALALGRVRELYDAEAMGEAEMQRRAEIVGLAALKFFLLDKSPQTTMVFNPDEALEFTGRTGAFLLYAYARTHSILAKGEARGVSLSFDDDALKSLGSELELPVIRALMEFPSVMGRAAQDLDPGKVAAATYEIARAFAKFYSDKHHKVLDAPTPELQSARLQLVYAVQGALASGLGVLGIDTLKQM